MSSRNFVVAAFIVGSLSNAAWAEGEDLKRAAIVGAEIGTIANQLSIRPKAAIDFSEVSGEYCFFTGWDAHHTHYAIDPTGTQEDLIDFVDARPLLEQGIDVSALPAQPAELGKMTPKQWYYLAPGNKDPHHGKTYDFPVLMRASDLQ
ncbi:MAG: hypothetical protein ACE5GS_00145 [Kiloniellaceae bacterium]